MSGASSNAAARRRRAAQPQNSNRLRSQPNVIQNQFNNSNMPNHFQQNQQYSPNVNYNNEETITIDGLPGVNGKVLHPVEILKNLHKRVIQLEENSNNLTKSNNELDKQTNILFSTKIQELEKTRNDLNVKINNSMNDLKSFETTIMDKNINIENTVSKLEDKINELKELCSKIQTFSMETNMSFMIFKNQFENQYNTNNNESLQLFNFINEHNLNDCNSNINCDHEDIDINVEDNEIEAEDITETNNLSNNKFKLNNIDLNNEEHNLNIQEILSMSNTEIENDNVENDNVETDNDSVKEYIVNQDE